MDVTKFLQRQCVTYSEKDGLSASFNNSKPTRQRVLSKKKVLEHKTEEKAQPSDVCLRCGMLGR